MRFLICRVMNLAYVGLLLTTGAALADDCSAALKPDIQSLQSDDSVRLSWLNILDVEKYQQAKEDVNGTAGVLVDGLPLRGSVNYGSFSEARSREFRYSNYQYSREQSLSYLQSKLSDASLGAWVKCMELNSHSQQGFHMWAKQITNDGVVVRIIWNIPQKSVKVTRGDIQAVNTVVPAKLVGATLGSAEAWEGRFPRNPDKEFYVAANLGGYPQSVQVFPAIKVSIPKPRAACRPPASNSELGFLSARLERDINNDGCTDFCRVMGDGLLCTYGTRAGDVVKPALHILIGDKGYDEHRYWVDYDNDGLIDFCRVIGHAEMVCRTFKEGGFTADKSIWKGADRGYGGRWADMNGDGWPDFCRLVGGAPAVERCVINHAGTLGPDEIQP